MNPKPIETRYAGCRFRSRLEARWAVFFERLNIRWEYEPQGYVIDETPYLPDFQLYLPDERTVFAEVKDPSVDEHTGPHIQLCRALAQHTGHPVVLLSGTPTYRLYNQFAPDLAVNEFQAAFFQDYGPKLVTADADRFQSATLDEDTGVLHLATSDRRARKAFGRGLVDAVTAARSARFEHGETP